ncbi:Arc family DNA-binding protein [Oscillospiraceae bacterium LTW-04]|nr:Arc family DNA-binding protein [Oscillospiraceae bacterium MB24-C1]
MQSNSTPFSLRIPKELLLRLKRLAKHNKRSANREAEQILEDYLNQWEKDHPLD